MPKGIYTRYPKRSLEERFWCYVDVHGSDECWPWLASKCTEGYGKLQVDNKTRKATHVLFYLRQGYWPPKGRFMCHKCDNRICCNPRHLYLGTRKSNVRDMVQRGRCATKLTPEDVCSIRAFLRSGKSLVSLARRFGVHQTTIGRIGHRELWVHLPFPA